jgi:hypothetical protein
VDIVFAVCIVWQQREESWERLTAHFKALRLDVLDHLDRRLLDVGHVLAMAVFPEEAGCADDDIEAVNTRLDGELGIAHVTTDVLWSVSRAPLAALGWTAEIGDSRVRILAYAGC